MSMMSLDNKDSGSSDPGLSLGEANKHQVHSRKTVDHLVFLLTENVPFLFHPCLKSKAKQCHIHKMEMLLIRIQDKKTGWLVMDFSGRSIFVCFLLGKINMFGEKKSYEVFLNRNTGDFVCMQGNIFCCDWELA